MQPRTYRSVIVTTDAGLRDQVRAELGAHPQVAVSLEIATPLAELSDQEVRRLREVNAELVFVDLSADTQTAIEFVRFLTEHNRARRVIGIGPELASETLIAAMRAGIGEYLRRPFAAEELADAIGRVLRYLGGAAGEPDRPGQVFTFLAAKGGDGTTTLATNVAIELHRLTGERTVLVDLDLQLGEIALVLGLEPRYSLIDLAKNLHRLDPELLGSYVQPHGSGIHVLAAPLYPAIGEAIGIEPMRAILAFLRRRYAFTVIDAARPGAAHTAAALERADRVVAVTQLNLSSLRNLKRCVPILDRVGARTPERIRLVINRYEPTGSISLREVEAALELPVHRTLAEDREAMARASAHGTPLVLHQPSTLARQIRELAADLADVELEHAARGGALLRTLAAPVRGMRRRFARAGRE
ncbi:MAG TPA: hypothetical protein VF212_11570 [Longimicrobiales bacterium]